MAKVNRCPMLSNIGRLSIITTSGVVSRPLLFKAHDLATPLIKTPTLCHNLYSALRHLDADASLSRNFLPKRESSKHESLWVIPTERLVTTSSGLTPVLRLRHWINNSPNIKPTPNERSIHQVCLQ